MKSIGNKFLRLGGLPSASPAATHTRIRPASTVPNPHSIYLCNLRNLWLKSTAFTLLELLVAMAVMALLVVMLLALVDTTTKLWRANENRVESYREARVALNMMASDLRSLLPSTNESFFSWSVNGEGDAQIGFLTALPLSSQDTNSVSDACSVAYFLAPGNISDIDTSAGQTWSLYRYFTESNETFARMQTANPEFWPAAQLVPNDVRTEIVARNIRAFRVRPYRQNGNEWVPWTYSAANPMPQLLEIEIEAVNPEMGKRFDGDLKNGALEPPHEQVRILTTRIPIRQPVIME